MRYIYSISFLLFWSMSVFGQKTISDIDSIYIVDVKNINYKNIQTIKYVIYNKNNCFYFYSCKILSFEDFLKMYYHEFHDSLSQNTSDKNASLLRRYSLNEKKKSYTIYKDTITLKHENVLKTEFVTNVLDAMQAPIYEKNETVYEDLNCSSTFYFPYFDITIFFKDATKLYWYSDSQCDIILPWKQENDIKTYNMDLNNALYNILPDFSLNKSRLLE